MDKDKWLEIQLPKDYTLDKVEKILDDWVSYVYGELDTTLAELPMVIHGFGC